MEGWQRAVGAPGLEETAVMAEESFTVGSHRYEVYVVSVGHSEGITIGVCENNALQSVWGLKCANEYGWRDLVGVELNSDSGTLSYTINGHSLGVRVSGLSGKCLSPAIHLGAGCQVIWRILDTNDTYHSQECLQSLRHELQIGDAAEDDSLRRSNLSSENSKCSLISPIWRWGDEIYDDGVNDNASFFEWLYKRKQHWLYFRHHQLKRRRLLDTERQQSQQQREEINDLLQSLWNSKNDVAGGSFDQSSEGQDQSSKQKCLISCTREYLSHASKTLTEIEKLTSIDVQRELESILNCSLDEFSSLVANVTLEVQVVCVCCCAKKCHIVSTTLQYSIQ